MGGGSSRALGYITTYSFGPMNRSLKSVILITVAMSSAALVTSTASEQVAVDTARNATAEIYREFLSDWTGSEHAPIYVSKSADLATAQEIESQRQCAKEDEKKQLRWTTSTPITDLGTVLGDLPYIHLVEQDKWKPQDPGVLISKGQSVESAVSEGFSHGLMTLSAISFTEGMDRAMFTYSFVCGGLCGNGGAIYFDKTPDGWKRNKRSCGGWIS